jgi:hypothetical protein
MVFSHSTDGGRPGHGSFKIRVNLWILILIFDLITAFLKALIGRSVPFGDIDHLFVEVLFWFELAARRFLPG